MRAVIYQGLGELVHDEMADPQPAPEEVIIKVRASGICHTDIDILYGRYGNSTFPLVPGHEYAGEIVAIGSAVDKFKVSDRVVVDPNFHCGTCRSCQKGLFNMCAELGAYGVTRHGGFAELSAVHQDNVVSIGTLAFDVAALAEPIGCVLNGLDAVETDRAENALIFGAGPIGLLMAFVLRSRGVEDITLVDLAPDRLTLAESFGFAAKASASDELHSLKQAVDLVVDATGVVAVAEGLISYCADGGNVLFFGVCAPDQNISISPHEVFRRQIRLAGAHSLNHNIAEAIATIEKIGPQIERLISHRVPLSEITDFLSKKRSEPMLKVQMVSK